MSKEIDPIIYGDYIITRKQADELKIRMAIPIRKVKYDWREVWMHNTLKFFGIKSTIISEELHEKSKEN